MAGRYWIIFGFLVSFFWGCHSDQTSRIVNNPGPCLELSLLKKPPVMPQCELYNLPDYQHDRSYLVYDLNDDGSNEYFLENCSGVHTVYFALVDSAGKLLMREKEVGEFGGDRIVILNSQHHGYRDLLCSNCDPGGVDQERWEFNGKRYVRVKSTHFTRDETDPGFVECIPGMAGACWYADMFGRPSVNWHP